MRNEGIAKRIDRFVDRRRLARRLHGVHRHPLRIFAGSANRPLADEVAAHLDVAVGQSHTTRLPDTEVHVQVGDLVRGHDIFFIQPCSAPVNDTLMELLLYIDAFRRASAHSITAVVPYFPYARQERMARGREAISARVVANAIESSGVERVIFVDIHARAIQGFFNIPVDPLSAMPVLAGYFNAPRFDNAVIVSPDVGRAGLAGRYAEWLHKPLVVMHKRREGIGKVETTHVVGDVEDKIPIVIDDIMAGGSVLTQVQGLLDHGARREVYFCVTHPVLLPSAMERLGAMDEIKELVVSNTIYVPAERQWPHTKVRVLSIAPMLANVIRCIHRGESIGPIIQPALPAPEGDQ
jgi:ribose-phosphate pyrophosphokinase